ncbi:FecR family protein [Patescibacteria group bacterium]|nr:FecR family protein [Patescibacteria group bacterium]
MIVFILLIAPFCSFTGGKAKAEQILTPRKVTATSGPVDIFVGSLEYKLSFWNVGSQGGAEYGDVVVTIVCLEATGDWDCSEEDLGPVAGTFTGGPNGHFVVEGIGFDLIDGRQTTVYDGGYAVVFNVDNPEAFDDQVDTEIEKEKYTKLPTSENWNDIPDEKLDYSFPKISKILGEVEVSDPNKRSNIVDSVWRNYWGDQESWRKWEAPAAGQDLTKQSVVKTGIGMAVLEFEDGTKIVLGRDSRISINDAGFTIENGSGILTYKKYGSKFILESRRVRFGIVGTTVSWVSDGDEIDFKVLEGKVEAAPEDGGETIILNAGEEISADERGLSAVWEFDESSELDRWDQLESEIGSQPAKAVNESGSTGIPTILLVLVLIIIVILIPVAAIIVIVWIVARRRK